MKVGYKFEGGQEIAAALLKLSDRGARVVQREALEAGAEVIRPAIAHAAPRRPPQPDIADHIVVSRVNAGDVTDHGAHGGGLAIGPAKGTYYYGSFLEFGTSRMAAEPFVRPGFDQTVEASLRAIGSAFWRELAARGIQRTVTVTVAPSGPGRTV